MKGNVAMEVPNTSVTLPCHVCHAVGILECTNCLSVTLSLSLFLSFTLFLFHSLSFSFTHSLFIFSPSNFSSFFQRGFVLCTKCGPDGSTGMCLHCRGARTIPVTKVNCHTCISLSLSLLSLSLSLSVSFSLSHLS